ncbi:hypothetical protein [Streptomyces sp. B21-083]|uniref:hypothetical protein n=1 Tax=Streptomyces sp. B21-083 TaxID=3039410 RepID=UPI002FEF2ACF
MPSLSSFPQQNAGHAFLESLTRASGTASDGGFNSTFTWAALIAVVAVIAAFVYRWFDKIAKLLEKASVTLDALVVELDKLADKTAKKADLEELKELLSRVKQDERRFPKIPFGTIVATIEAYEKTTVTEECAKRLTRVLANRRYVDEALKLSREQGTRIADIRAAINDVQRVINRKLLR